MKSPIVQFAIGGAMKSGTSTIASLLNQQDGVYSFDRGYELHFFGKDRYYEKGIEWYHSHFGGIAPGVLIGEKSVSYLEHPEAAQRIRQYNPDMKLIFILRNPVDRAYSHYKYTVQLGTEYLSFEKAVQQEKRRRKLGGFFANNYAYLHRGYYYEQLQRYYDHFPDDQMHVVIFEEFKRAPHQVMQHLCDFLGIGYRPVNTKKKVNKTQVPRARLITFPFTMYRRLFRRRRRRAEQLDRLVLGMESWCFVEKEYKKMPRGLRQELIGVFEQSNHNLERLLGRDLSAWRT